MNRKRVKSILAIMLMIIVLFPTISQAWFPEFGEVWMYDDVLEAIESRTGEEVIFPIPQFELSKGDELIAEGKNDNAVYDVTEEGWDASLKLTYEHNKTIMVGDSLKGVDKSILKGKGKSIKKYDWQVVHWDRAGQVIHRETITNKNAEIKARAPGFIIVFLNVADDQVFTDKNTGKGLYDWWFNATKIKVEENNDIGITSGRAISKGKPTTTFIQGDIYQFQFDIERLLGSRTLGTWGADNPGLMANVTITGEIKTINENIMGSYNYL